MQKSINGLSPGSTYVIQVASIDGQGQSYWSPTLEITIPKPVLTPNPPTNVTATGNPDNIKISWTQATLNTDNTSLAQPAYYQVYQSLTSTVDTNGTPVGKTSGASFTYETTLYDVNQYFNVVTVDGFGNRNSTTANVVSAIASVPSVMSGLISKFSSYIRSSGTTNTQFTTTTPHGLTAGDKVYINDTIGEAKTITAISLIYSTAVATTNSAHYFNVGDTVVIASSSDDSFNETVLVTAVTTSSPHTFTYSSKASGTFTGYAYTYASVGTSTVNTPYGAAAEVLSVSNNKTFICSPNSGISPISNIETTYTLPSVSSDGTYVSYTTGSYVSGINGFKLNVSGCLPNIFNTDNADITYSGSNTIKIKSSATGSYTANSGTAVVDPPGYAYPSDNAVRIKSDGITIGNMSTGYIVGISPTSFNMQSSGSSTRLSLTSSEIAMYKSGEKTVSLDGTTGDATIVGKFATGFPPDARVQLDSGSTIPESISFYSGAIGETDAGLIYTTAETAIGSVSTSISSSSNGQTLPQSTINVLSTTGFASSGTFYVLGNSWTWIPISYTGTTATTFTGCSGGSGQLFTGQPVAQGSTTGIMSIRPPAYGGTANQPSINLYSYDGLDASSPGVVSISPQLTVDTSITSTTMRAKKYFNAALVTIPTGQTTPRRNPDTDNAVGLSFQAPYSGTVLISVSATLRANAGGTMLGWYLRTGSTIASTTLAAAMNGLALSGRTSITVASTTNFDSTGTLSIQTTTGVQTMTYTGKTATTFTGLSGTVTGNMATGGDVHSGQLISEGSEGAGSALILLNNSANNAYMMASSPQYLQTGLGDGFNYNVTFSYKTTSASNQTAENRQIIVIPQM